jgi:hypothetical protein
MYNPSLTPPGSDNPTRRQGVPGFLTPVSASGAGPDERGVKAWMEAMGGSYKRRPVLEWSPEVGPLYKLNPLDP